MKRLNENVVQTTLHNFFGTSVMHCNRSSHQSKRIQRVLGILKESEPKKKRGPRKKKPEMASSLGENSLIETSKKKEEENKEEKSKEKRKKREWKIVKRMEKKE